MNTDRHLPLPAKSIAAVLLVLVCVMFFMEWANVAFRDSGFDREAVKYVTRIVGLPLLSFLVWLVVREHGDFLNRILVTERITFELVVTAIAIGLLARVFWWSQVTVRIAFGWLESSAQAPTKAFSIGFSCPEPQILFMAMLVWLVLVPLCEEFVHRGVLMSALGNRGPALAISGSALIFALMHRPTSIVLVFFFGIVLGMLFWNWKSLWAPIIMHATYDGLIVLDWVCLKIAWNPSHDDVPLLPLGAISAAVALACLAGISFLLLKPRVGPELRPNPRPGS